MARPAKNTAQADTTETKTAADGLIVMAHPMYADLRVHPTQIDGWKIHGWQVVE